MTTMSVKELSSFLGKSPNTIRRAAQISELPPAITGMERRFDAEEVQKICDVVFKKVPPAIQEAILSTFPKNGKAISIGKVSSEDRLDRMERMVEKLIEVVIVQAQRNSVPLIDQYHGYYSILAYCKVRNITATDHEKSYYGKIATQISKERSLEVRILQDERWGKVGSYHESVLKDVFGK